MLALPVISVKSVLSRRERLVSALSSFVGQKLVGETFHAFVDKVHANLTDCILRTTVHNSVKCLLKQELTFAQLTEVSWRLAGNLEGLLEQKAAVRWVRQVVAEWVPVQICDIRTQRLQYQLEHELVFQSLAGTIVPRKLVQVWSGRKVSYLATYRNEKDNGFGFGRSHRNNRGEQSGHRLFHDVRQFYGLRCFLLVDPAKSQHEPIAVEVGHTSGTTTYNTDLLRGRDREQSPCHKGLLHECFHCPYGADKCSLATHAQTYVRGTCSRCSVAGFLDPLELERPDWCVNCILNERKS